MMQQFMRRFMHSMVKFCRSNQGHLFEMQKGNLKMINFSWSLGEIYGCGDIDGVSDGPKNKIGKIKQFLSKTF